MSRQILSRISGRRTATAALLSAAVGGAAIFSGCRPADGQTTATAAPTIRVDEATPRADSGVVGVARRVTPAVVYIEVQIPPRVASRGQDGNGFQVPPGFQLPPGFDGPGSPFARPQQRGPARASGSGFIVAPDGYILTNNHVVADANKITVSLTDGRIFPARVIGRDPTTDVALIKIDGQNLPTVPLGDDRQVQVGQPVVAIGNPLGLRSTVTSGIISAKERGAELNSLLDNKLAVADFLQTDAVINPGNSGGPLVDLSGRVVGINSAIESPTGVYAGYGFAVPIGIARTAMDQILKYGHVRRALLGVTISDVKAADAQAAGLSQIRGALVGSVTDNSGAKSAGLQPGDIITAVDGQPIASVAALQRTIYGRAPGSTVSLTTQRYGTQRTATVTLTEAPQDQQVAAATTSAPERGNAAPRLGIQLQPVTPALAQQLQIPTPTQGLVVTDVDPNGPSAASLQKGDVIRAVLGSSGARPVRNYADLQSTLANASSRGVVSLLVSYRDLQRVVNIPLSTR